MIVTYLSHSGFHVELKHCCLLFDYFMGDIPIVDKPLYVFVSHQHADHYNTDVAQLDATFIVHHKVDLKKEKTWCIEPQRQYNIEDIHVQTLFSTDEGVAFLVEVEGKKIYHAGDLHLWHWEGEQGWDNDLQERKYKQYLQPMIGNTIDVAFVVLDPRLEKQYDLGMQYFINTLYPVHVFPMHMWGEYTIIDVYNAKYPTHNVVRITKQQERFVI